jgi:hypothetical protein
MASTSSANSSSSSKTRTGLRGLKQSWQERREDKRVEKGGEWGLDGGRLEECRVVEMLDAKWDRENSAVNVQQVPDFEPLLAQQMPSGREYHAAEPWNPLVLDAGTLVQMRAPLEPVIAEDQTPQRPEVLQRLSFTTGQTFP